MFIKKKKSLLAIKKWKKQNKKTPSSVKAPPLDLLTKKEEASDSHSAMRNDSCIHVSSDVPLRAGDASLSSGVSVGVTPESV